MAFSPRTLSLFVAAIALLDVSLASAEEPIDAQPATWDGSGRSAHHCSWICPRPRLNVDFQNRSPVYAGTPMRCCSVGFWPRTTKTTEGWGRKLAFAGFSRSSDSAPRWIFGFKTRGVLARVTKDGEAEPGGYVSALGGYTKIIGGRWGRRWRPWHPIHSLQRKWRWHGRRFSQRLTLPLASRSSRLATRLCGPASADIVRGPVVPFFVEADHKPRCRCLDETRAFAVLQVAAGLMP